VSGRGGSWFWIGAGLGIVVSAAAVVISTEFYALRKRRMVDPEFEQGEHDLVEDLTIAVHEGMQVLGKAASEITHSFTDARREVVRFGLDPQGSGSGGGSSAWYTGDEE